VNADKILYPFLTKAPSGCKMLLWKEGVYMKGKEILNAIKKEIDSHVGEKVLLKANGGRKKVLVKEGILEKVTEQKKKEQLALGKLQCERFGIQEPEDVFIRLPEVFNCALWEIQKAKNGFIAESKACRLCTAGKKMGSASPCRIYCLNPMEGMVKGLSPKSTFEVKETLWEGQRCRIEVWF
jgi:hypothetical protein